MTRTEVLSKAKQCICVERESSYGNAADNFAVIAWLWSAYKGVPFDPVDVPIMMTLLKIGRISTGKNKDDNYVDAIGYVALAAEISDSKE